MSETPGICMERGDFKSRPAQIFRKRSRRDLRHPRRSGSIHLSSESASAHKQDALLIIRHWGGEYRQTDGQEASKLVYYRAVVYGRKRDVIRPLECPMEASGRRRCVASRMVVIHPLRMVILCGTLRAINFTRRRFDQNPG